MKIMLDAGHGYDTPGKRSPDGFREYEFNRVVANYAKSLLETYTNVTVYFAHSDKQDVPLQARTDKANRLNVDLYVSIHSNASGSGWSKATGIETYVYQTRFKVAYNLAKRIQRNLVISTGLADRGVKTADFHVLRETAMDAVLVECGFYTNKEELKLIKSDAYRKTCAEAIVKGIVEQFKLKKASTDSTDSENNNSKSTSTKKNSSTKPPTKQTSSKDTVYKVQIGSFDSRENAEELANKLKKAGYEAFISKE